MRLTYSHFYNPKYCLYSKPIKGLQGYGVSYRFSFNGKENIDEITSIGDWQDYGERFYCTRLGRFPSPDPLIIHDKQYPELSPYQFASNTPIQAIDLDGLEAYGVYNKATGTLALIPDISKTNSKLDYKFVSAFVYKNLTPEQKSKTNFGILVKNVFTGGHSTGPGTVALGTNAEEKPISKGSYNILENKGNTKPDNSSFLVLDPVDNNQYDKVDNRPGEINSAGEQRDGYNLHPGVISHGCVTLNKYDPDLSLDQRKEEWGIIRDAIGNTKTEQFPDNRGRSKYIPGRDQTKYGTLQVIDEKPKKRTE